MRDDDSDRRRRRAHGRARERREEDGRIQRRARPRRALERDASVVCRFHENFVVIHTAHKNR